MFLTKNVSSGAIKDVDSATGTVTGYFSIFGNVDSDGDIVMPGAFKRSLNNNYKRIKHLNQHRSYEPLSATKNDNLVVKEDDKGLYFESKISKTSYGKDTILLYLDGVLDEHSIGYEVTKSRDSDTQFVTSRWDPAKQVPVKELIELYLWEGSTVTWGANKNAGTSSVKSLTKEQAFEKMNGILKAIKNGKYEQEEVFEMLELNFKQLEQHILDLSTQPEVVATSLDPQKSMVETIDTGAVLAMIQLQKQKTA